MAHTVSTGNPCVESSCLRVRPPPTRLGAMTHTAYVLPIGVGSGRKIEWDSPHEAIPLMLGEIGAEELRTLGPFPTPPRGAILMWMSREFTRPASRPTNAIETMNTMNLRAMYLAESMGAGEVTLFGSVIITGYAPLSDPAVGSGEVIGLTTDHLDIFDMVSREYLATFDQYVQLEALEREFEAAVVTMDREEMQAVLDKIEKIDPTRARSIEIIAKLIRIL
jgi:hypothetical protein